MIIDDDITHQRILKENLWLWDYVHNFQSFLDSDESLRSKYEVFINSLIGKKVTKDE